MKGTKDCLRETGRIFREKTAGKVLISQWIL